MLLKRSFQNQNTSSLKVLFKAFKITNVPKYLIFLQNEQVLLEKDNKLFVLQGDLDLAEEKLLEIENSNKKVSFYDNKVKTRPNFF